MKKLLAIILLGLLSITFVGCDEEETDTSTPKIEKPDQPSGGQKPKDHPAH